MSAPGNSEANVLDPLVIKLFDTEPAQINQDLGKRVEVHAQTSDWQSTNINGLSICVLEYIGGEQPRMTAMFRLNTELESCGAAGVQIPAVNLELLVQHGMVADDDTEYLHPFYLRQPKDRAGINQHFTLYPGSQKKMADDDQLEFYVATGQLEETDTQRRCINLTDHSLWLPGPVEHTEVMPLHMHNGNNSMLVRWLDTVSFRPRLDPRGEEVLVINGTLTDELGSYTAGSWIRNPVATWQSWSGNSGTLIYYKNGHFGTEHN